MRRLFLIVPAVLVGALAWALVTGADMRVAAWAAGWQREFQTGLAGSLRALRAGEPGAVAVFLGVCFAYGFFHAVGPGHGKILIGGYGIARRVTLLRLAAIALLSSLGQAVTAIVLVLVGLLVAGWTRQQLTATAETLMLPASTVAIGLVGLWLALRGARTLWRLSGRRAGTEHDHDHDHAGCGHRHAPGLDEVERAGGTRDTLMLMGGVAIRPCSGAILLLVLTAYMDMLPTGIAGTVAMAVGTGALTVAVAVASVFTRESTLLSLGQDGVAVRLLPVIEVLAGLAICLTSAEMLARVL